MPNAAGLNVEPELLKVQMFCGTEFLARVDLSGDGSKLKDYAITKKLPQHEHLVSGAALLRPAYPLLSNDLFHDFASQSSETWPFNPVAGSNA